MNPAVIAGIAGIGQIAGGVLGNRARRDEAQRNRMFQERMRNTSWQAAVADMEAAGINPAVAYSQGGAAAPGGSMAAQENVGAGLSSAMQNARLKAELRLLEAQERAALAQGEKTQSEAIYQKFMNMLWGTRSADKGAGEGRFIEGPLFQMHRANARQAAEAANARSMENVLLKNLADVAGTDMGKALGWLRYLIQSTKGR